MSLVIKQTDDDKLRFHKKLGKIRSNDYEYDDSM